MYRGGSGVPAPSRPKKARKKGVQVAGPYRSQSSIPEIREEATPREHRKVPRRKIARLKREATVAEVERAEKKALKALRKGIRSAPVSPHLAYQQARDHGVAPPVELRKRHPRAYEKAEDAFLTHLRKEEGLKEDPLAELVIGGVAGGVVGSAAKVGAKAGSKALSKVLAETAEQGATKGAAAKAGQAAKRAVKKRAKRKVERVRSAPERARTAPKRAKRAVKTEEGRRKAAKGAARTTATHPVRSFAGAGVASNQVGADVPGLKQAGAFVEGHVEALKDSPGKTLKTTARAIPGIVASPVALIGSAASSVASGSTEPLEREVSKQAKGLVDVGGKLLSGDSEKVQRTVEDEVGLSFVAPAPALSRISRTKGYQRARGKARKHVATKRQATRAKRQAELRDYKTGARAKQPRKIRHAVRDTATGEERILRPIGKAIEGRRQRRAVSTASSRAKAQGEREALLAAKPVVKHLRRSKLAGGKKGRVDAGDALATVVAYGIPRDRDAALRALDQIETSIGKHDPDAIPTNVATDLANIRFLREHPEVFSDKHFWRAADAYKRQAREVETSGRKKVLAIGDAYGLKRPEEMLEDGVTVRSRTVRSRYIDPDQLARKQADLSELRSDARTAREGAARARNASERARYGRVAAEIAARAKTLERELRDHRTGRKAAEKRYGREAQEIIRREGLEQPAYVKDVKPRQGLDPLPTFPAGRSARKQHMSKGVARERGVAERNFETLVNQSIAEPRMRRAMHRLTTEFVERWAAPLKGKRYLTSAEIERAINRGELDAGQYAVLHSQFFKQAILDPHKAGPEFTEAIRSALDTSMLAQIKQRANDPGNKYIVVPREALKEFVHQMEPPKGMDKVFGGANRLLSRVILGYSPGWAAAQLIAEGVPAAMAIGANPARWMRVAKFLAREDKRLGRKDRAAIDGIAGESAGVTPHPHVQFRPDTNVMASRFLRLSKRNPVGRALLKGASGEALGIFDRWKGGKYRKAVAAAKADRELNSFVKSLSGLMRGQRSIVEAIKGKPLKAQMEYIAKHPAEAAKLEGYLDNVMGNWRALTRHEAKFAPLVVFYPFVRYSLRWTFWAFPREHPVKASILYFLSQQNAEELEKLIGGPPANPLEYTFPVYESAKGGQGVLPGGSRIAPGMNALTTSIGKGQVESLATALNPALGIGVSAVTGVDPLSGEKKAHSPADAGLLALNQLLSMPAPARLLDLNRVGQDEPSGVSEAFAEMDPLRDARSALLPLLPQSGARYADSARLGRALEESGYDPELGDDAITRALEGVKRGDLRLAKRLKKRRERSDAASDEIGALVREYIGPEGELPKLTDHQYEWLGKITGKRVFPYEPPKPNPFGLPDMDADDLREQFGIPATSPAKLREQFGIELP